MAATSQSSSRLQMMQARFQQRQLQEKEQKLLQIYDQQQQRAHQVAQRGSAGSGDSAGSGHPAGKVQRAYEERRQNNPKGIDKSYPLEPLNGRSKRLAATSPAGKSSAVGCGGGGGGGHVAKQGRANTARRADDDADAATQDLLPSDRSESQPQECRASGCRENASSESRASCRRSDCEGPGTCGESIGQRVNGRSRSGQHYEINIDEVIDNEAMQRNRMLAKFHSLDIEKRRRFSADIENQEVPEKIHDVPSQLLENVGVALTSSTRRSCRLDATAEQFEITSTKKSSTTPRSVATTVTKKHQDPPAPKQSTFMKTTKSASLKVKKLPRSRKAVQEKRIKSFLQKSKQFKGKSKKYKVTQSSENLKCNDNTSANCNDLKSISLICDIIRNHSQQVDQADNIGKVNAMIIKIEKRTAEEKRSTEALLNTISHKRESVEDKILNTSSEHKSNSDITSVTRKRSSIFNSEYRRSSVAETSKIFSKMDQKESSTNIETKDQGDGPTSRKNSSTTTISKIRDPSVERPTDHQEMTIAYHSIKDECEKEKPKRPAPGSPDRVRRASFEMKRMMFEQIQSQEKFSRRDSVESALQHFDSIEADAMDLVKPVSITAADERKKSEDEKCSANARQDLTKDEQSRVRESDVRICNEDCIQKNTDSSSCPSRTIKGFEKHTRAWTIKTFKAKAPQHPKSYSGSKDGIGSSARGTPSRRKLPPKIRKNSSKKLLEARDSIELARFNVKIKLPACRRKIVLNSSPSPPAEKTQKERTYAEDVDVESRSVENQSFPDDDRVTHLKSCTISNEQISKNDQFSPSTTKNAGSEYSLKKASETTPARKNTIPHPSSKSLESTVPEQKRRPAAKPTSLKLQVEEVGSNGDMRSVEEREITVGTRKFGLSTIDSPTPTGVSRHRSFDEEKPGAGMGAATATAPRSTSSMSSSSSVETTRSHGSSNSRLSMTKGKLSTASLRPVVATPKTVVNDDTLTTCKICNRRFALERITLHEQICSKTAQKKRKQFDAGTHRIKGTEFETFVVHKPKKKQSKAAKAEPEQQKSNWRRKHEDFINAIRSAKQMQAHLAAGGKLSDLPPPPPSDTSDYVKCPHCSRKFNQAAADRHIPKCETMQHNKPKPRVPATGIRPIRR